MRYAQQISFVKVLILSTILSLSPLSALEKDISLQFKDIYDRGGNLSEVISETDKPLAVCPYCDPDAAWPPDIVPVYTKRVVTEVPNWQRIKVTGLMSDEPHFDQDTSVYSKFRLRKGSFKPIK